MRFLATIGLFTISINAFAQLVENAADVLPALHPHVVINEIFSNKDPMNAYVIDEDGDYTDWIEIYNAEPRNVRLKGWYLSDDPDSLKKWKIPDISLRPNTYRLIYASGKDRTYPLLHTNFRISKKGEPIILSDAHGNIVDLFDSIPVPEGKSYGRWTDATDSIYYLHPITPGFSNDVSMNFNVIELSKDEAFQKQSFNLDMTFSIPINDTIYYTLDGTVPYPQSSNILRYIQNGQPLKIKDGNNYQNALSMIPTTLPENPGYFVWQPPGEKSVFFGAVLKARSYKNGIPNSDLLVKTFFVSPDIENRYTFPIFSITTDSVNLFSDETGIYVPGTVNDSTFENYKQRGMEWERVANLEYYTPDGECQFSQTVGLRVHGGKTRYAPQKTLRVYARDMYGEDELEYPFFKDLPYDEYKRILLRNTFADYNSTIFIDDLLAEATMGLDFDVMASQPSIVFINGEYWGIHSIRERIDRHFLKQHHPEIDKDEIDLLADMQAAIMEGNNEDWKELIAWVEAADLTDRQSYQFLTSKIDMDNYVDYMVAEIYFCNRDWPEYNVKYWRTHEEGFRWRWVYYDLDAGFGDASFNMMIKATSVDNDWNSYNEARILFRRLLSNESFKHKFVSRMEELVNTSFRPEVMLELINKYEQLYLPEIDEHIRRWNHPASREEWLRNIDKLRTFAIHRPCEVKHHVESMLGIDNLNIDVCGSSVNSFTKMNVFPNPSRGSFNVDYYTLYYGEVAVSGTVQVIDGLGRVIIERDVEIYPFTNRIELDLSNHSSGLYHITISTPSDHIGKSIIISRR